MRNAQIRLEIGFSLSTKLLAETRKDSFEDLRLQSGLKQRCSLNMGPSSAGRPVSRKLVGGNSTLSSGVQRSFSSPLRLLLLALSLPRANKDDS